MPDTDVTAEVPVKNRPWLRRLRIAWTVFFAVLTVALCVLWVRSYWWADIVMVFGFRPIAANSVWGYLSGYNVLVPAGMSYSFWNHAEVGIQHLVYPQYFPWSGRYIVIVYEIRPQNINFEIPICVVAMITAALASAPWLPFRFSLRTMLIATTLVAVLLGLICYTVR